MAAHSFPLSLATAALIIVKAMANDRKRLS